MTDSEQLLEEPASAAPTRPRVVVLSFRNKPFNNLFGHVAFMLQRGVQVDLVVLRENGWADLRGYENLRVIPLKRCEDLYLPRRLERLLLFTIPGKALGLVKAMVEKMRIAPVRSTILKLQRAHKKIAGGIHHRIFLPIDSLIRPFSLAMLARRSLNRLDVTGVERIIAIEGPTWPSAWRLARRCPEAEATNLLDRTPYATLDDGQNPAQACR